MPFDASRYPNAVTIGWLISERMGMGVHCQKCARHVVLDPATMEDMCGRSVVDKPSLEVVYDAA